MGKELIANVIIKGKMEVLTGLHIGGSKEKLEIGGVDSPVIRDPKTRYPYIPGSSLKGKMRMLLEFALGKVEDNKPSNDPEIARIFGMPPEKTNSNLGPTRLVVRDAFPDKETIEMWKNIDSELQYTEYKPENSIDRITSEANPRFLERVVKGSKFNIELVYSIYDWEEDIEEDEDENVNNDENELVEENENKKSKLKGIDKQLLGNVFLALRLLEHSGLGGNISRGYGRVKFELMEPIVVFKDDYQTGKGNYLKANVDVDSENVELKPLDQIEIPEL